MNDTSLSEFNQKRFDSLERYQLDESSVTKFRRKIKKSDDSENLGKELFDLIKGIKGSVTEDTFKQMTKLVIAGANPNYSEPEKGDFPLIICARKGYLDEAYLLLRAGASVNQTNSYKTTALMAAARHGHDELVEILILLGADVNAICLDGDTALISAIRHSKKECIDILVNAQAAINHKNYDDITAIDISGNDYIDTSCMIDVPIHAVKTTTEEDVTELIKEAQKSFNNLKNR